MSDPEQPTDHGHISARESWSDELERLQIVEARRVRITRDEFRRLRVTVDGQTEHIDLRPAPVFPISGMASYLSLVDEKGKEVLLLRDPENLDPDSLQVLQEEISRTYFVPRITRIYHIEDAHGAARWEVETDRGFRVFDIRDREDVRFIGRTRLLLQDADGNRFEIADINALDERSRHILDGEV